MKKTILSFLFVLSISFSGLCTHIMGGEIIAEHNGNNNYRILLTMYRDTIGINTDTIQTFNIWHNGAIISTITTQMDPNANHPIFGFQTDAALEDIPVSVRIG